MDVKFKFKNFAGVETCDIQLKPLTVLAGPNSAGKTYIVYAIYSLLKKLPGMLSVPLPPTLVHQLIDTGAVEFDVGDIEEFDYSQQVTKTFLRGLPGYFSVNEDFFENAEASITVPSPKVDGEWETRIQLRTNTFIEVFKQKGSRVCLLSLSSISSGDAPERAMLPSASSLRYRLIRVLTDLAFADSLPNTFPITSERTGISLFWKELDISKNQIIDKIIAAKGKKINAWEFIDEETSRYALPITDNIDVARDAENVSKQKSFIASDANLKMYIGSVFDKISGGRYKYGQDGISFEYGSGKRKKTIPIYVASSSSKSLFLLDLYLNNVAQAGDVLVFDEPELNLHLANQRLMAQLLLRLVSIGVNVVVTTHSDFLIREFNDRIMLSSKFSGREELMAHAGIDEREVLSPDRVAGYLLRQDRKLTSVHTDEFGLRMDSIDEAISGSARLQSDIISLMTA